FFSFFSNYFFTSYHLNVENNVEYLSFSLGLTQDFGETSGSMSKSNTMQEIKSKLRNDPIRFLNGGIKDKADVVAGSSKKRKDKTDVYTEHNDKSEVVVSGSLEHVEVYV
ncbi:hypothetical protein EJD97_023644, partial [Solanum chilense]